jgi:RHS repeat-associated protein
MNIRLINYLSSGWVAFDQISVKNTSSGAAVAVQNAGFEEIGSWTPSAAFSSTTWLGRDTQGAAGPYNVANTPTYGYAITNNMSGKLTSGEIAVTSDTEYEVGVWLRGALADDQGIGGWILRAVFYKGTEFISQTDVVSGNGSTLSMDWKQVHNCVTTPTEATIMKIELVSENASGWVAFDDVSLTKLQPATKYYFAGSQRIAMRKNGVMTYLLSDQLGSTSLAVDASGAKISEVRYDPWGKMRYSSNPGLPTEYTYTGQRDYTKDFGLMFYNARWYDSSIGRFAQADSVTSGGVQSFDRYAGMANNPTRYTDPSGHRECEADSGNSCMGVKRLNLWNYAVDTLNKLGGKDDLEAMARIIDKAVYIYSSYEKVMPELSEIFLGVRESSPLTILHAAGAGGCAGLGREPKDCPANDDAGAFWDKGFHEDFRDKHNQLFHFWAYVATTASTDFRPGGSILGTYAGMFTGQAGNLYHEVITSGVPGASWQDFALAQAGMNTGIMIALGVIPPNELGDYLRDILSPNSTGAPYVPALNEVWQLSDNK